MPQMREEPETTKEWEADKESPSQQDEENPKETEDWEQDKEEEAGEGPPR